MTLIGLSGVAFLAGGFAPASFGIVSFPQSREVSAPVLPAKMATGVKGDRVREAASAASLTSVSIIEIVGVSQATVILRGANGEVLYRADPRSGTTTFSKNTDLPILTLKEEFRGPAVQHPVSQQEGKEEPQQKRRNPVGCMRDVSPLAKASANRMPSLCLAQLDRALS
jgi:hypothetical protein